MAHPTKLGKFYPMTPETAKKLREAKLTAAEWRIWSYLVAKDPFGDRYINLETLDVMQECECSKATFYRAISKFQKIGLFDFQNRGWSFKNEVGISQFKAQKSSLKNESNSAGMEKLEAEMPTQKGFQNPKTNKTLHKINTLSERAREKFLNFCQRKADEMPEKVVMLKSWIEANFEELYEMWQESSGGGEFSAAQGSGQKNDSATPQGQNSQDSGIHPTILQGLKAGTLVEYDRRIKMVKIKGETFWTHEQDYLAMEDSI